MSEPKDDNVPDGYVRIGHIARAHGIKGDVVAVFYSDEPERFGKGTQLRLGEKDVKIDRARPGKDGMIVTFAGVTDRNAAELLKGSQLFIAKADRRQLADGEFWPEDLVGMEAVDLEKNHLGLVTDIVLDSAQTRLVIKTSDGRMVELPFVDELVPEVSVLDGRIILNPLEGLI